MKKYLEILIVVALFLIVVGAIIYLQYNVAFKAPHEGFAKREAILLTASQIQGVEAVFDNTSSISVVREYCAKERTSCIYYCRNIAQNNSLCSQVFTLLRRFNASS